MTTDFIGTGPNTERALVTALTASLDADTSDITALRSRLTARAEQEALLDVAYRIVDSPIGPLLVAASPAGLVRVAFEREGHDTVLDQLAGQISPRIMRMPARTESVAVRPHFTAVHLDQVPHQRQADAQAATRVRSHCRLG